MLSPIAPSAADDDGDEPEQEIQFDYAADLDELLGSAREVLGIDGGLGLI